MQNAGKTLILTMLTISATLANAQLKGAQFSGLPIDARRSISSALLREVPGLSWAQLAKLTSSDGQAHDRFGFSVAVSGDTVVVGLSSADGSGHNAAYVFVKPSTGWANMTETAELTPSNGESRDGFGYAVAVSGKTIVVAAPSRNVGERTEGAAYVFVEPTEGWQNMTETAILSARGSKGLYELALSGNTLVVSSGRDSESYVFVEPRTGWKSRINADATLTNPTFYDGNGYCGACVGVSGNTIAIGVPANFESEGTVYLFTKPTGGWIGNLNPTATLVASDGSIDDELGMAVAVSGNTVVAGANGKNQYRGALYVFVEPAGGWEDMSETAELTATDSVELGWSVAISENTILGGAYLNTVGTNQFQGAAYVYTRPKNGWETTHQFTAELTSSDGMPNDQFGTSVAINGNTAVVGAASATIGSNTSQGAAYVFGR
jgi:hypothetical protein